MIESSASPLVPDARRRRIAAQQFERARQAMNSGNFDYSIELLQTCCKLDPANLSFRKALRQTEKVKYRNNLRGSWLAWLTTMGAKARLKKAKQAKNHLKVLEHGEAILARNPWATGTQLDMAQAADALGLPEIAIWILEQARQKNPQDVRVNRPLAVLYEKQGDYNKAIALWDLVSRADPKDTEASRKGKDLAATHTILKGNYEEAARGMAAATPREPTTPPVTPKPAADPLKRQVEPLRKKIQTDPTNPNPYLQLAAIFQRAGRWEPAQEILLSGLAATGQNFDIHIALAELEIEPFRRNLKLVEQKIRDNPEDAQAVALRDRLEREIIHREIAIYRQRADRYPSDSTFRFELGTRLLRAGQLDAAIEELQQARRDPRNRTRCLVQLGYCFQERRNWALAKRNFTEALQETPETDEAARKEIMYQLALIAAAEKDWPRAIELGTELANLDFGYRGIGHKLDEWQQKVSEPPVRQSDATA